MFARMFARIENNAAVEYPVTEQEIRSRFPWVIFPVVFVPPEGYVEVLEEPQPAYDQITHDLREIAPSLVSKVWTQQWALTPLHDEQAAANKAAALKAKRESMVCTPWQIRKAMTAKSVRTDVESSVAAAGQEVQDAYAFAQEFKRLDPLGMMIQAVLGKSDEYMDALFELGMTL